MTELDQTIARLRTAFVARLAADRQRLAQCGQAENWGEIAVISHRVAGAAGIYGFAKISALAASLEMAINKNSSADIRACNEALAQSIADLFDGDNS